MGKITLKNIDFISVAPKLGIGVIRIVLAEKYTQEDAIFLNDLLKIYPQERNTYAFLSENEIYYEDKGQFIKKTKNKIENIGGRNIEIKAQVLEDKSFSYTICLNSKKD